MKRYEVTMSYFRTVEVLANSEKDAIKRVHMGDWDEDYGLEAAPDLDEVELIDAEEG